MKELEVVKQALNKANKEGVFTLEESAMVINALGAVQAFYNKNAATPSEDTSDEKVVNKRAKAKA